MKIRMLRTLQLALAAIIIIVVLCILWQAQPLLHDRSSLGNAFGSSLAAAASAGNRTLLRGAQLLHGGLDSGLDVYIVEEHHEALPYWCDAALKSFPALLVHIDAHPDFAPAAISNVPDSPPVAPPTLKPLQLWESAARSRVWVEGNDEFIAGAVRQGLLEAVLWVHPSWDRGGPRHDHSDEGPSEAPAESAIWSLYGTGHLETSSGETCFCETQPRLFDPARPWPPFSGTYDEVSARAECFNQDEKSVRRNHCKHMQYTINIRASERKILEKAETWRSLVAGFQKALLDIDEDFFGQVNWYDRVAQAIGMKKVKVVNELLSSMLCPGHGQGLEQAIHEELVDCFSSLAACLQDRQQCGVAVPELQNLAASACSEDLKQEGKLVEALAEQLQDFSAAELEVLAGAGFCFDGSPSSFAASVKEPKLHVQVCSDGHDSKDPYLDTDNSKEAGFLAENGRALAGRFEGYRQLMRRVLNRKYVVGTVARSVRDGYTSRRVWASVEAAVRRGVDEALPQAVSWHWDLHLLGGRYGRPLS